MNKDKTLNHQFDFTIIGSCVGGSVSAMRLTQKGYDVAILEMGKRLRADDFPKTNWNFKKYFWAPLLRFYGPQKIGYLPKKQSSLDYHNQNVLVIDLISGMHQK